MEYRNLGSSGLKVSRLVMGGAHLGELADLERTRELVHAAWDVGVTTFYTADDYNVGEGERVLGDALRPRREDLVLIVKGGYRVGAYTTLSATGSPRDGGENYDNQRLSALDHNRLWRAGVSPTSRGMSRKHLTDALEASLRRLGTDYVDVYAPHYWDPTVPVEETLETLDNFVRQGKVRYLGCSQHTPWQLMRALWVSDKHHLARYESIQVTLSLLERGALTTVVPALTEVGVSMFASGSDAGGLLSGKYDRIGDLPTGGGARQLDMHPYWNAPAFDALAKIAEIAGRFGRGVAELAAAWTLARPSVVALNVGPQEPAAFEPLAAAVDNPLTAEEDAALAELLSTLPASLSAPPPAARIAAR